MAQSAGKVAFVPKGDYDEGATYRVLDVVMHEGSSYAAKKTTVGNAPTVEEYWQVLAKGFSSAVSVAVTDGTLSITSV